MGPLCWEDYYELVQQEYAGNIKELEKDLASEKIKTENLQQRIMDQSNRIYE